MPTRQTLAPTQPAPLPCRLGMVWIPAGTFHMGETAFYPEEAPVREVTVAGFWIDRHPVTNEQFSRFIASTRYVTRAEQPDSSGGLVFQAPSRAVAMPLDATWWHGIPGAGWRHPRGPETTVQWLARHPVVQISLDDALAYCAWAGGDLPTEAEWEFAARAARQGAVFTWGDEERPNGAFMANTWQGSFPHHNTAEDGFRFTSPVGSFPANGFGLLDMAGNVWEWTGDPYHFGLSINQQPGRGAARAPYHVIKGGSYLCAPATCFRYRPAARQPHAVADGACDLGFRVVMRPRPDPG